MSLRNITVDNQKYEPPQENVFVIQYTASYRGRNEKKEAKGISRPLSVAKHTT